MSVTARTGRTRSPTLARALLPAQADSRLWRPQVGGVLALAGEQGAEQDRPYEITDQRMPYYLDLPATRAQAPTRRLPGQACAMPGR
jgi:hypothetical protein